MLATTCTLLLADGEGDKLCIDKLACHRTVPPPRIPVVLVSCGSFNPPTIMHLRMFDLATEALAKVRRGCMFECVCRVWQAGGGGARDVMHQPWSVLLLSWQIHAGSSWVPGLLHWFGSVTATASTTLRGAVSLLA